MINYQIAQNKKAIEKAIFCLLYFVKKSFASNSFQELKANVVN